ncbi:MAG: FAD binding domain-containing protein [Candidatus Hydrogenedentes bacterium]|nr:FAD binding domain-containing protein [Candidatus Hydrogenedentota bacterium]
MKSFEYARPASLDEAFALLSENWGETEIMAGGTDLVTAMKQYVTEPNRVVSLRGVAPLRAINATDAAIEIGAMATLREVLRHDAVKAQFPAVVTAIQGIASPQMLSRGTIGGELCQRPRCWYFRTGHGLFAKENGEALVPAGDSRYHAIFGNQGEAHFVSPSSLGPVLVALGATLRIQKGADSRDVPADAFFQTPATEKDRETVLKPNEILTAIVLPVSGAKNATYEVRHRHGLDWPYTTASVSFVLDGGKAKNVRIALGHVAPTPWVAKEAQAALEGQEVTEATAAAAGAAAVAGATPFDKNGYKLQLVKTAVKRALLAATA